MSRFAPVRRGFVPRARAGHRTEGKIMDNWDDFRFLLALSKAGTMKGAAQLLGTNIGTVSRRIDRLSTTLGTEAFIRTADGWKPSATGLRLAEIAQEFDGALKAALNDGPGKAEDPVEMLIGCPPIVRSLVLFPGIRKQQALLTNIRLSFTDRIFREGLGENDLVIKLGPPNQGRVVGRRAGAIAYRLYGFREDRAGNEWVGLDERHDTFPMMRICLEVMKRGPSLRVEGFSALYELMQATRLPGPLPDPLAACDPELVPLDPATEPHVADYWVFYHESRRNDPVMRRAVDWVLACFSSMPEVAARPRMAG